MIVDAVSCYRYTIIMERLNHSLLLRLLFLCDPLSLSQTWMISTVTRPPACACVLPSLRGCCLRLLACRLSMVLIRPAPLSACGVVLYSSPTYHDPPSLHSIPYPRHVQFIKIGQCCCHPPFDSRIQAVSSLPPPCPPFCLHREILVSDSHSNTTKNAPHRRLSAPDSLFPACGPIDEKDLLHWECLVPGPDDSGWCTHCLYHWGCIT